MGDFSPCLLLARPSWSRRFCVPGPTAARDHEVGGPEHKALFPPSIELPARSPLTAATVAVRAPFPCCRCKQYAAGLSASDRRDRFFCRALKGLGFVAAGAGINCALSPWAPPSPRGRGRGPRLRGRVRGYTVNRPGARRPCLVRNGFANPSPSHRCAAGPSLWERAVVMRVDSGSTPSRRRRRSGSSVLPA